MGVHDVGAPMGRPGGPGDAALRTARRKTKRFVAARGRVETYVEVTRPSGDREKLHPDRVPLERRTRGSRAGRLLAVPSAPSDIDLFLQRQEGDGWSDDLETGGSASLERETLSAGRGEPGTPD